jgi:hypothetical protein
MVKKTSTIASQFGQQPRERQRFSLDGIMANGNRFQTKRTRVLQDAGDCLLSEAQAPESTNAHDANVRIRRRKGTTSERCSRQCRNAPFPSEFMLR